MVWRALLSSSVLFLLLSCAEPSTIAGTCETEPAVQVSEIYPTANSIPSNILRFYIYFDAPMQTETVFPEIKLKDDGGNDIDDVFLENRYDLWSRDGRRLTLLLNPGRVKTGITANEQFGNALEKDRRYNLTVGTGVLSADGCGMSAPFSKSFVATNADTASPSPMRWELQTPVSGSRDKLQVRLDGIHDHVSLAYRVRVQTLSGDQVAGRISVSIGESEWHFTPSTPWQDAEYSLVVDPLLEDVAGNRLNELFDAPSGQSGYETTAATVIVPFSTRMSQER
ncbi:MAG: hypothetical protein AAF950_14145 [Pseudomonadota bacterium]